MKYFYLLPGILLFGCAGGPPPPAWQAGAKYSLDAFQQAYLRGETRVADLEFARARAELASTGSPSLVARAELIRCAARTASLEFDDCPGFEKLRADAGPEELAYADFLAGRAARAAAEDPVSRLVSLGVQFKAGKAAPESIASAVELASAQGWRRPLLAWLGVEEKRAEAAGDAAALAAIRRRIALVSGKP
ncbi:MAG TPA: hypothetical protein VMT02_02735 [Burkholderiales bacterium]|nr:hypothetical protein [Burkholderiales bacterium]